MNSYPTKQEIIQSASHLRSVLVRSKQVSNRLSELKESVLKNIEKKYRPKYGAAKARRLALLDAKYHSFLKELLDVNDSYCRAKLDWDLLVMKRNCEKSYQTYF